MIAARHCFQEWLRQFPVSADAIEQQQRRLPGAVVPDGNLEQLPVNREPCIACVGQTASIA
jgi:hypothetical protein